MNNNISSSSPQNISQDMINDFLNNLLNCESTYTIIDKVDLDHYIIAILKKDYLRAITYFIDKYEKLPDICILDMDKDTIPEINKLNTNFRVRIFSPVDAKRLQYKTFCLWVDPLHDNVSGPGESSILVGINHLRFLGIKNYFIDKFGLQSLSLFYDSFYSPRISPDDFAAILPQAVNVYYSLHDKQSKDTFLGAVKARVHGSFGFFPTPTFAEYFHPDCCPEKGDIMIDGGIWDQRVVNKFLAAIGEEGYIYAFEPLPSAYKLCAEQLKDKSNITLENLGLADKEGEFMITSQGEGSHLVSGNMVGAQRCLVTSIDEYVYKHKIPKIDMIKLDVEGAEPDVLKGAINTIMRDRPKLAISIYHKPLQQLIQIPQSILDLNLGYKMWVGHHTLVCFGTILYATAR